MTSWHPTEPDFLASHTRAVAAAGRIVAGTRGLLGRAVCEYRVRRDLRAARRELLKLDDRLLRDIGLTPGDLGDLRWLRQPRRSLGDPLPVTDIALDAAEVRRCGGLRLAA